MNKGIYVETIGDITKVTEASNLNIVIPHVCNNIGAYGAGVALAIKNKWRHAYYYYYRHLEAFKREGVDKKKLLGKNSYAHFEENGCNVTVVNMIAQKGLRNQNNRRPLNYGALVECMSSLYPDIIEAGYYNHKPFEICTVKFGSDLAGGNWNFIKLLIEDIWLEQGIDVTVYNLK